jgi:hypothetical protein
MPRHVEFKRMILGLPHSTGDYPLVGATVKLAELLRMQLLAMFADDRSVMDVAGLPFARELRPLGGGWQSLDVGQLSAELERSSAIARRLFDEAARNCSIDASFCVEKGAAADIIASVATAEDIVVVIEPRNPAERVTQQFIRLIEAAFRASASVMIVPCRIARFSGPVVALAAGPEDPSIDAAAAIASAARERLIVMGPRELLAPGSSLSKAIEAGGGRVEFVPTAALPNVTKLADDLQRRGERLLVVTRGVLDDLQVPALASRRSVPVVVVEPSAPNHDAARGKA